MLGGGGGRGGGGEDFVFQSIEHVFDTQSTALHWFYSCLLNILKL